MAKLIINEKEYNLNVWIPGISATLFLLALILHLVSILFLVAEPFTAMSAFSLLGTIVSTNWFIKERKKARN